MFDKSCSLLNNTKISVESCKSKDLWITDFVILHNVNKVLLAFTTKELAIYELSTKMEFNCQYKVTQLKATALCLDYWHDPNNPNDSILTWGDTLGEIHTIHFNSAMISLFEKPTTVATVVRASQLQQSVNGNRNKLELH
jgi:WD repeat-containing protein 49